jgi:hypothetical protein
MEERCSLWLFPALGAEPQDHTIRPVLPLIISHHYLCTPFILLDGHSDSGVGQRSSGKKYKLHGMNLS